MEDQEFLFRLECLIKHLGGSKEVDPSADECDSSVGTFLMFVIRDALEHAGLLIEKKCHPNKAHKLALHKR